MPIYEIELQLRGFNPGEYFNVRRFNDKSSGNRIFEQLKSNGSGGFIIRTSDVSPEVMQATVYMSYLMESVSKVNVRQFDVQAGAYVEVKM